MPAPSPTNPQGRTASRAKQPIRHQPGKNSGARQGWRQPRKKKAKQPATAQKGSDQQAAPVKPSSEPPFLLLDRASVNKRVDKALAPLEKSAKSSRSLLLAVAAILFVVYLSGALFFRNHFLPGTTINGLEASWKTPEDVAAMAKAEIDSYKLAIEGDGLSLTLVAKDIGLICDEASFISDAGAFAPSLTWPVALTKLRDHVVEKGLTFDRENLRKKVTEAVNLVNEDAVPTRDAMLSYQQSSSSFTVIPEQQGTAVDTDTAVTLATKAVDHLQEHLELDDKALVQPTILSDDPRLVGAVEQANARKDLSINLTVYGQTVKTIGPEDIRVWLEFDDSYHVTADLDAITEWARGPLSDELDSTSTVRAYVRPNDGKYIEVRGGTYGWVIDGGSLAQTIYERINESSSEPIEVPMRGAGAVYAPGGQDWGPRYLDVDLSEQYVRLFDEGSNLIWASECVSGDTGQGNDTVTGVYTIYDKESPKTLIGLDYDGDGEPDYENEVLYWMPFYGGYGLHDASWRSYFGQDAYLYGGSHGCINLPQDAAQLLYSLIEVDDVVVVHY